MIDLENSFFLKEENGKVIYRMSDLALDDYMKSRGMDSENEKYLYGDVTMVLTGFTLQSAILSLVYKDGKKDINVTEEIAPEIIDDAIENLEYDAEAYGKTLDDFYKF